MAGFEDKIAQLVRRVAPGGALLRSWPLKGGISARMTGLEIGTPGGEIAKWVLRQHGDLTRGLNPRIAADEFRLLQILQHADIPVPAPRHLEPGAIFGTPCIVLDHIEGESGPGATDRGTYLGQLATCLARIHTIGASDALAFLPRRQLDAGVQTKPPAPANRPVLLHGDFWPGNVLSRDGGLVAVIDWEDAAIGDPLADLATTRLELLWTFDREASERFTELYLAMTTVDAANLAHWDLRNALLVDGELSAWGLDAADLHSMRAKLRQFIGRARAALA
jgi:aminoglycoside phosphotransferase (APT) family kinase protein